MAGATRRVVLVLLLWLCLQGESLDDDFLPSGAFRDDVLFEMSWPGAQELKSEPSEGYELQVEGEGVASDNVLSGIDKKIEQDFVEEEVNSAVGKLKSLNNFLMREEDYKGLRYLDMRTGSSDERYRCVLPEILSWEDDMESDGAEDPAIQPESLLKSLAGRCTKLIAGYWMYELCHGKHVRQYHEPMKQPKGKEDEFFLGRMPSSKTAKTGSDDGDDSQLEAKTSSTSKKEVPVWYFNGNEYPYYPVEMGGGTPCNLKDDEPRSLIIRYICDLNAHETGTFLHVEETTTCKYEAVVATTNLCQNRMYRLRENPIHTVKCYSKDGSPSKPNSLLEHEIAMLQNLQGAKHQKSPTKPRKPGGRGEGRGEEGEQEEDGGDNYPSDSRVNRESVAQLDEGFIRAFLSGELCLRGGSGWWLHEICYGKHVKQIHEEAGRVPDELYLGYWMKEGHVRWFPNAGQKKQSKNHVVHLYMNGDMCDVTGVPRQCKVRFRCSESARASQISLFLEEPTTCNYILTVEAAFLCPLLKDTDEYGLLGLNIGAGLGGKGVGLGEAEYQQEEEEEELEYDDDGNVKSSNLEDSELDSEQSGDRKKSTANQR